MPLGPINAHDTAPPGTTLPVAAQAAAVVERILALHADIMALPDEPLRHAHTALYAALLVTLSRPLQAAVMARVLRHPDIMAAREDLRRSFARAAFHYELLWARAATTAPTPWRTLERAYPLRDRYARASLLEHRTVGAIAPHGPPKRLLVAGAGPLPSTAFHLAEERGTTVDALDISAQAVATASDLAARLGLERRVRAITGDIHEFTTLERYDAVWLAALVGDETSQSHLFEQLARGMRPGAMLVVRTAIGLRALLYPTVAPDDLVGFSPQLTLQPCRRVYHASVIAECGERGIPAADPIALHLPEEVPH